MNYIDQGIETFATVIYLKFAKKINIQLELSCIELISNNETFQKLSIFEGIFLFLLTKNFYFHIKNIK